MKIEECEIVSIEDFKYEEDYVYNLEIEDNHNYFANDILVSNCHLLPNASASVLLKVLEEPPPSTIFILATTNANKILPTIKSRCQRFELKRLKISQIIDKLQDICNKEEIEVKNKNSLGLIARSSQGSMRNAISFLDAVAGRCGKIIEEDEVIDILGLASQNGVFEILAAICSGDITKSILEEKKLISGGAEPMDIFNSLIGMIHDMLISQSLRNDSFIFMDENIKPRWNKILSNINPNVFSNMINKLSEYMSRTEYVPRVDSLLDACVVDLIGVVKNK